MASIVMDWVARRRVAREEADAQRLFAAAQASETEESDGESADVGEDQPKPPNHTKRYDSLPYTPSCCSTPSRPGPAYPITIHRDIAYWTGEPGASERHQLDIYYSPMAIQHHMRSRVDDGRKGAPVTIHVHGGGWQRGDRKNEWRGAPNAGRAIARHGMIGVCPSYRLSPIAYTGMLIWGPIISLLLTSIASIFSSWVSSNFLVRWMQALLILGVLILWRRFTDKTKVMHPEPAFDVARAVKWVRENLHTIVPEADVDRIFLSGHSAGGHLVALLSSDPKYYAAVGLQDTSFIRGVCCVSAIYNVHSPVHINPSSISNFGFRLTYGAAAFGYTTAGLLDASPYTHVTNRAPPFLLLSAASDMGLETDASRFKEKLEQLGVVHEYHTIEKTSHASIASHFEKHEAHVHLFRFIDKCCSAMGPAALKSEKQQEQHDPSQEDEYVNVPTPSPRNSKKKTSSEEKKQLRRTNSSSAADKSFTAV
jgi:acetyl esterase/lipase